MNKFLAIVLLVNVWCSSAVYLKHSTNARTQTFAQLNDIRDSEFGARILDTIALQLANKSPLQDVASMLKEIRQNLALQQTQSETLHRDQEEECKKTLTDLNKTIGECQGHADDAESKIGDIKSEIKSLKVKIINGKRQIDILEGRMASLKAERKKDHNDYVRLKAQGPAVVKALDLIIEKLGQLKPTSAKAAFAELSKIGKTNPIASLLQIASTFSKETLDNVTKKLTDLKEQIENQLENNDNAEAAAVAQFKKIINELEKTLNKTTNSRAAAIRAKEQAEGSLAMQQKRMAENVTCVQTNTKKKTEKTSQCAIWNRKYEQDKVARAEEIKIIVQVEEIVATKLNTMKDYLKKSANS